MEPDENIKRLLKESDEEAKRSLGVFTWFVGLGLLSLAIITLIFESCPYPWQ
jgi:hypothetical protein